MNIIIIPVLQLEKLSLRQVINLFGVTQEVSRRASFNMDAVWPQGSSKTLFYVISGIWVCPRLQIKILGI